ncbi:MAG: hypothetical protein [Chaetfec virus UA24_244]|nr:MAG: hypothetical protein [Chaetfec virus UA24_244]
MSPGFPGRELGLFFLQILTKFLFYLLTFGPP